MDKLRKIKKRLRKIDPQIQVSEKNGSVFLQGEEKDYRTIIQAGQAAVDKKHFLGVINDIKLAGFEEKTYEPALNDKELDGQSPDVLIIGGGISGTAIARELSKWKLNIMLLEKGPDIASGASKANGGVIHVGINFPKNSLKFKYNYLGNKMYSKLAENLEVPFQQKGQVMLCFHKWEKIPVWFLVKHAKKVAIPGVEFLNKEELKKHEPFIPQEAIGGMYMPSGGITSPFEMTLALGENAVQNGAKIYLNSIVKGMEVKDGTIISVLTNRGTIYPKLVINAAGVFADQIADMAADRTFTIHPRRGTDIVTDKKAGYMVSTSMAKAPFSILNYQKDKGKSSFFKTVHLLKEALSGKNHTKGVGLIHSVHQNMLIGPNAIETPYREDTSTYREEVDGIIAMQQHIAENLKRSDIIAYFTGVRAPTYEEDFVVRKGIFTSNIIEVAGIQSPGITAAPAIGVDVSRWAVDYLSLKQKVTPNGSFDPHRKRTPVLKDLSEEEREKYIKRNPDYGIIVCRCEEVSKGEIIDALSSPLKVATLDGIKQRLRPGMGRCQGGFCTPLVMQIIAEHEKIPLQDVKKSTPSSFLVTGLTKGETK
ncbi:MAG: NAD(P)/FAD-dependent oxidoreductase [Bacilli bacterium]|jgi:glycerol-3-phosphate dehydrogenase|nr:NAD(P)/FAD-dependent oxidoreductase [Bacilli bacterium]